MTILSQVSQEVDARIGVMIMREFIRTHRDEIDSVIRGYGIDGSINDEEREQWVNNDEGLYRWAQQLGVKI